MQTHEIVYDFDRYLQQTVGARESTRRQYIRYIQQFLREKFCTVSEFELDNLRPSDLIQFMMNQKDYYKSPFLKAMTTALRSFLRFLQMKGLCEARLVKAIPAVADWKLSQIPKYLTNKQLEMLLSSFNRTAPVGLRDYAIALCLARLGLRRSEVAYLMLDDIDWRSGTVQISAGKVRRADELPLPKDVGKAIVAYLRKGRPQTQERRIFVRHRQPVGAVLSGSAIGAIIRRAFKRTGLKVPSNGTHILRHTVATHMVQQGISIKEVADILRHHSIDTTVIYAKVNLPMLSEVALPWPEKGVIS